MFALTLSAKRQSRRIRLLLFKHILRQDIAWFDEQSSGNLITKLSYNVDQIEGGIGDRLGNFIQNVTTAIVAAVVSLINGWKLALVSFTMAPFILGAFMTLGFALRKYAAKEIIAYERAGSVAAEILASIRTVFAFGCQEKESARYEKELGASAHVFILKCLLMGFGMGMIGCTIFCASALILWYGVELIITESYNNGSIVSVMISFIIGNTSLGRSLPEIEFFANAKRAAASLFEIIDRIPVIDVMGQGLTLDSFSGKIEFKNVSFSYPTRPDVQVLKSFSLTVNPGETVAIVGPSGSGKSTTIQLIQRFYDAIHGSILLDGVDIRDLNVAWLRRQLGVVSQEPNLFAGTVTENILMGKPEAEFKEVEESARAADAHNFIVTLPEAYNTFLTEGGGKLSGGQKQRLAIARALVRNPTILLLDEATSALDNKSEKVVQAAFDKACRGRTVIMIAHRLTTVRNADRIVVVDRGMVQEMGTHSELLAKGGIYANMVEKQPLHKDDKEDDESSSEDEETAKDFGDSKKMPRGDSLRSSKTSNYDALSSMDTDISVRIKSGKPPLLEVLSMNKPEWPYLAYGLVAIALSGVALPAFSLVYSEIYNLFPMTDPQAKRARASFLCGIFAMLGFLRLFLTASGNAALGISGARLTMRARQLFFKAMLKQEVAWFDRPENQAGILTARLATEVQSLHRVTGTQLSTFLECLSLVIAALVIAFYYNWMLSLIALAFVPALFLAGALQTRQISGGVGQNQAQGANVAQEAFTSYRTVAAYGLEQFIYENFRTTSKSSNKSRYGQSALFAVVHCLANGTFYFLLAAYYYTAAYLYDHDKVDMPTIFRIFSAVNFAAQGLGRAAAYAPDFSTASQNIKKTLASIHRETQMDVNQGDYPPDPPVGKFEFKNVYFRYPTRRRNPILRNFSHTVQPGTSVAMVGPSGCGKSTLLQLVQRLYDVDDRGPGSGIFLDGRDLRSLAPAWIREQIGIVSQEPNLFNLTIRENIAYGYLKGEPTIDQIIDAAKQANIHEFISELPEGYDTNVGAGGSQLSGGQKQRVAIARALLRKPKILLLDEATSALDVDNERIVQQTLDEAMREPNGGRTSLVVAHRLTTVMNCDEIVVIIGGRRVESGSPHALLQQKGAFYEIHNLGVGGR
ncbi:ATP-dependent translocase ABCB1 [Taenia crassiceps]|uniref:ATP-dependent translocase ABCB1 n=1 Tax=Taenia crassiceps TaxID=6207 RepID=A0ABR4QPE9_9CEST